LLNYSRTFRLCIPRDDCNKLLNAGMWPEHISISRWIFNKNPRPYVLTTTKGDTSSVAHRQELAETDNKSFGGGTIAAAAAAVTAQRTAAIANDSENESHEYHLDLKNYSEWNESRYFKY